MSKKVVIIGGGIAGLNAAIELLQNGYDVSLYEKNPNVGGLCYGYFKDGYNIDTCLHWLMGTKKGTIINKLWYNIDALNDDVEISQLPNFCTFFYEGVKVTFSRNIDEEEKRWKELSPRDEKAIESFFGCVRSLGKLWDYVQTIERKKITMDLIKHFSNSGKILQAMKYSRDEYSRKFTHPALRFAIKNAMTGYNNAFFFMQVYGLFSVNDGNVPMGGAYYMIDRIKNKFLSLGGDLHLNTKVDRLVLDKNGSVKSIRIGKELVDADYFISALDVNYTLKELLSNKYHLRKFNYLNKNIKNYTISSCFCVYIKVKDFKNDIDTPTHIKINKVKVGSKHVNSLLIRPYAFDKTFDYKGDAVISLFVDQDQDDYNYLEKQKDYKKEHQRIVDDLISEFVRNYPQYENKIEVLTSFGPLELNVQTNTSYGSIQSYSLTDKGMFYSFKGKLRKIPNLYMCGQWNRSIGGTPTALLTSHYAVEKILKREKYLSYLTKVKLPKISK